MINELLTNPEIVLGLAALAGALALLAVKGVVNQLKKIVAKTETKLDDELLEKAMALVEPQIEDKVKKMVKEALVKKAKKDEPTT